MNIDTGCHACSTSDGSILHVLRDCTVARNFWLRSGLPVLGGSIGEKPDLNWFKLNIDGSSIDNPVKAGGGGIIRNHHGNWVRGFARSIGIALSDIAELWALKRWPQSLHPSSDSISNC
ncbi:hypothetical protein SO802_001648 [Lithocarpus litseifolius]|uniref:RNase H type-1 domain-containing protein n=1 Tax=Lithocarpus litseifolius TaxID=425828 RepID=A0AAW2DWW0_9ROSI